MKKLLGLLEEIQEEKDLLEAKPPMDDEEDDIDAEDGSAPVDDYDDDEEEDEKIGDHAADGKGHYTADDLREIIDYVRDLLKDEKEDDDDDDDDFGDDDDEDDKSDQMEEIGLDLIYEYADLLPETVINQIVDDLKDMFEIEDTMLEAIVTEGSKLFNKSRKSPAAAAARKKMMEFYKKNKAKINKRNAKWRAGEHHAKMSMLHKKAYKSGMGRIKGKRIVGNMMAKGKSKV